MENEDKMKDLVPDLDDESEKAPQSAELSAKAEPVGEGEAISPNPKNGSGGRLELYDWVQCVVAALVIGILFFVFVARVVNVDGSSMYPTLHHTDTIITSKLFYTPKQGDVVVVQTDSFSEQPIVKRVIATEGQTVRIDFDAHVVYVDGKPLEEDYINAPTSSAIDFPRNEEVTVPEGCMFLMGDNRNESTDSRDDRIGMVDRRCIIGKVIFIAIPSRNENGSIEWSRMGTV